MLQDLKDQSRELQTKQRKLIEERDTKASRIKNAEAELRRLDSQAGQQEIRLKNFSSETAAAWKWIQENADMFEHEVFGPPMVVCSVKDPKYTDALESLIPRTDLLAFTVQSMKDFRTLQAQISGTMRLHDATTKMCSTPFAEASQRPQGLNFDLNARGFDGWAIDYLSGPEPVLAMLCTEQGLHMSPLRLRDISNQEFDSIVNTNLRNWVAGRNLYSVKRRREYGPSAQSTSVRTISAAKTWTNQPLDVSAKRDLQDNITGWTEEHDAIVQQLEEAKVTYQGLKPRYIEIEKEQVGLTRSRFFMRLILCRKKSATKRRRGKLQLLDSELYQRS
jgi:hypothetical protein